MEKLLKVPEGFNNNIWWNIAHVVVTHQLLHYALSNLPMHTEQALVAKFRKGTFPEGIPSDEEFNKVKEYLIATPRIARDDYAKGIFKEFNSYTTSLGVNLKTIEDAMAFNAFHEGLHLGVIMSLKKFV